MSLPEEIARACASVFEAVPFCAAMPRLDGSWPHHSELVEEALRDPALAGRDDLAAGLWLYVDDLERCHAVCQDLPDPTGAWWHGIMHRREPDYNNSRYWMGRAAGHPLLSARPDLDPVALVNAVESAGAESAALVAGQRAEWQALFEWCAKTGDGR